MKKALHTTFTVLITMVLFAKIANWFLDFSDETNRMLNMAMFSLIGIAYLVMAFVWDGRLKKIVILSCGLFLIVMNFFSSNVVLDIIGIACILTPMLIARFDNRTLLGGTKSSAGA